MEGWNVEAETVDVGTGELTENMSPLVQSIIGDPEALAALRDALLGQEKKDPLPVFGSTDEFVEKYVTMTFLRRTKDPDLRWCESWWRHPEARAALNAMWRSWEKHRREDAMASWLIYTGWPIMDRLTGHHSPFEGCKHAGSSDKAEHTPAQRRLPIGEAPADLFPKVATKAEPNR